MISIWKQGEREIVRTAILEPDCWVHVSAPTPIEVQTLQREHGIPADVIQDILDPDERSRSERDNGYHLIILRIPAHDPQGEVPYYTLPLGIVLLPKLIITICARENELVEDISANRVRNLCLTDRLSFVLRLMLRATNSYLRYLKELNRKSAQIEHDLRVSVKNVELVYLLNLEKSLVYFTTSLKSNELLTDKLQKSLFVNLDEARSDLLEDVVTEGKQAIEMANIYSNILSGMMDAFASVISNNLNVVMKRLTAISLILMIPTLIASLYGMNVALPFQHSALAFLGIVAASVLLSVGSVFFFLRKRYF
jgi:magnesium transporter